MVNVAINGFGRIGRIVLRQLLQRKNINVIAINDLTTAETLAHLFKYDSVHGKVPYEVSCSDDALFIDGKEIKILAQREPSGLPWKLLKVDIVIEATGLFTTREWASQHLEAGAKKVIITAPAKNEDITIVNGVNQQKYEPKKHHIISASSCSTHCLAVVCKVLLENFGIEKGTMTALHSYTNNQKVLDLPHQDLRLARAAALSIIPAPTGASKSIGLVLPKLKGKIDGHAMRVPTPNVSMIDLVVQTKEKTTIEEVNRILKDAAEKELKGILAYTEEPLVSVDFISSSASATIDSALTMVIADDMVKTAAWYDNEMGYSTRVADLIEYIEDQGI
jgi:glyceraldehyde 3-phosphate dehydrogenase